MPRPQVKAHQSRVCRICGCTEYKRCRYLPRRGVPWTLRIGMRFCLSTTATALSPPVKWSYRKLILWWALLFLSTGWIVFYINTDTKNSSAVLSPPLTLFAPLSAATFLLLPVLFWRHNQTTYKRRYARWERSFLCQRCGTLTEQE